MTTNQARGRYSRCLRRAVKLAVLACSGSLATGAFAQETMPTGGEIVAGQGTIAAADGTMTVTQLTDRMIANWQGFSIGAGNTVNFVQPGASSVALNRVTGQDPSQILGSLNANGQVFLVNPNGMVVGRGAQVSTGGFVGSSLDIADRDFLAGVHRFTGTGAAIRNEGNIAGDVVALIAPSVVNDGTIVGDTALAAGTNVLLDFNGDGLLSVEVEASTVATLVENNGLIRADGGVAILTAKGASDALKGVVNNNGTVQAHTLASKNGRILLLADLEHGEANIGGTLDASAPTGGDGGFIETSGANVKIADDVYITTRAAAGTQGEWLIDPNDFTIAASGGNITGSALSSQLARNNVTISTWTQGTPDRNGDIFVNDTVRWSDNILVLVAQRNIVVNTAMNGSGTAGLNLIYGQGAPAINNSARYILNAPIDLPSMGTFMTRLGNDGAFVNYTIITSVGTAGSSGDGTLQGIRGNLGGNYVLGADVGASDTSLWNSGGGFAPLGDALNPFTGTFDGLGHVVSNFHINRLTTNNVGLFGATGSRAIVRNVGLEGSTIIGNRYVGGLVGQNGGRIEDSYSAGAAGMDHSVGGLVGVNFGAITRSYATGAVTGFGGYIGGLVGVSYAGSSIEQSYATGTVIGATQVGGLVGASYGTITESHAHGNVTALADFAGGLVGLNGGYIGNSYASGIVTGPMHVGGLVGVLDAAGRIERAYATGAVTGTTSVGGLVGATQGGTIGLAYATGDVRGDSQVGGLIGTHDGNLWSGYATGHVMGNSLTGGLVGSHVRGVIGSSFYDAEATGRTAACGSGGSGCVATGLTTEQMKDPFNFIDAGWHFGTEWGKSRTGENDGYMVLRSLSTTEYDYYVRLSDVSFRRTYGDANPALSGIRLDGLGAGNVTLDWGSALASGANVGTYALGAANVLSARVGAGTTADYYFDYGAGAVIVDPRAISLSGSRVYDGTTGVESSLLALGNLANGESLTLSGIGALGDRNAGSDKMLSLGSLALGDGTGLASNYTLAGAVHRVDIDRRSIDVASVAADDKIYDGTTNATLNLGDAGFAGIVAGDDVVVTAATGAFSDKNAGVDKIVDITGVTLGGADVGNYVLARNTATTTATVTPRAIDAITGITANDKEYDGTTAVTLDTGSASFVGAIGGDDLTVAHAQGRFARADPGDNALVLIDGLSLGGADARNYTLVDDSATAIASIHPVVVVPPPQPPPAPPPPDTGTNPDPGAPDADPIPAPSDKEPANIPPLIEHATAPDVPSRFDCEHPGESGKSRCQGLPPIQREE